MTPMFFLAALWGCIEGEDSDSAVVDDSAITWIEVEMTVHAAIDGTLIDPVEVGIYEATGETGDEPALAIDKLTGEAIVVTIPKAGKMARAWIGSAAAQSSDGHRILEHNGRQWVHTLADLPIEDGREATISLNGYLPYDLYHCVMDAYGYDDGAPDFKGDYIYTSEGDHWLEVTSGQDILDDGDGANGIEEFIANGCSLQSFGSGFAVECPGGEGWVIDSSWTGNGFTISASFNDVSVNDLTCAL